MNNLQKLYKALKLVNLILVYLFGKLVSSGPIIFDDNLKVIPVAFLVVAFNLSSYESDNFTFTMLYIAS